MNEIKVTVTYNKPTTSKFDALMAEYEAAKKYADETVEYYKPLADVAEDAKFDAIMEQLKTIKEYAKRICEITGDSEVSIYAGVHGYMRGDSYSSVYFEVIYKPKTNFPFAVMCDNVPFVKGKFCSGKYNFVGKWEEWRIYEQLEKSACDKLQAAIKRQKLRAQDQIDRLNNIIKGGN